MHEDRESTELAQRLLTLAPRYVQWAAMSLRAHRQEGDPSFRQLAVLFMIREGVTSPASIAQQMGISRAVVTGLLDRLEERGLIRRELDPRDRRRLCIVMTDAGMDASERLGDAVVADMASELGVSSPQERAVLAAALDLLERKIEILLERAPACPDAGREPDPWDDETPGVASPTALHE
jgi:DNA-binding MarR family transcriptional regulator